MVIFFPKKVGFSSKFRENRAEGYDNFKLDRVSFLHRGGYRWPLPPIKRYVFAFSYQNIIIIVKKEWNSLILNQ